jgi:predicted nucleotidyltransferase
MESQDLVERGTILRATVGSTVHGLHHGGQDDRDEMAVFIEPPQYLVGLARAGGIRGGLYGFEHYVERTEPEGMRSGPGDLDLVAYSLRKYVRLALKGHPTILLLLSSPRSSCSSRRRRASSSATYVPLCSRKELDVATSVTSADRRNACSARAARSA